MGKLVRKVPKKKILKQDDKFVKTMKDVPDWFEKNKITILLTTFIVIFAFAAVTWIRHNNAKSTIDAEVRLHKALTMMENGRDDDAEALLEELNRKYKRTVFGKKAVYYLASYNNRKGNYEQAVELYDKFLRLNVDGTLMESSARLGKAIALANAGKLDEAISEFEKIRTEFHDTFVSNRAAMEEAGCWMQKGDPVKAKECYMEVAGGIKTALSAEAEKAAREIEGMMNSAHNG